MFIIYGIGALILCYIGNYYYGNNYKKIYIDRLKNALLAHAIFRTWPNDACAEEYYELYDGTKYPAASGYSTANACSSYFYSNDRKMRAINKYIENTLTNEEDITNFFNEYLTIVE
jgi:hypothetical protein